MYVETEYNFKQEMKGATLGSRKLSLHTGRTVVNEKKGNCSVGLSTLVGKLRIVSDKIHQIFSGHFLWHLAMSALQLFCSILLYSSNVFSAFLDC